MVDDDFDFSDCHIDGVREVLDVAVSVLTDYAPDMGDTRIERLARWVLFNLKADVQLEGIGHVALCKCTDKVEVGQVGDRVAFSTYATLGGAAALLRTMSAEEARNVATGLLLCADRADTGVT